MFNHGIFTTVGKKTEQKCQLLLKAKYCPRTMPM